MLAEGESWKRAGWERWLLSENAIALFLAVLVGAGTGLGIVVFRHLIAICQSFFFHDLLGQLEAWGLGKAAAILPTLLGGALVGALMMMVEGFRRQRPPEPAGGMGAGGATAMQVPGGVAGIIEATALAGGRLPYAKAPWRALAAALSIGSGASVGPEDPSVQIGANLGSALGQKLRFAEDHVRLLVAAGAASGIAAAFNAPIAGVFFALEVILGDFTPDAFGLVVLAAVVSSVVAQAALGAQPAFAVPPYELRTPLELPLYLLLGVLAAVVAVAYTRAVHTLEYRGAQSRLPRPLRTALGGLMVGLAAGLFFPQLFGVGYETIGRVLQGEHFPVALLGGLLVFKILLTALSLGMGFVGGVFAPSLFLGAMLGGLYGEVLSRVLPGMVAVPAAYAMVGMAAVLAGTIRAPLTATLILFEMTRDYRIILPLLAAVGVSVLIGERLLPGSIYLLSLRRRGINLVRGRDIDVMQGIAVEEAMSKEFIAFSRHTPLSEARTVLDRGHHHAGIVLDEAGELFGIVSINDIERMLAGAGASSLVNGTSGAPVDKDAGLSTPQTVGEICTRDVITVFPDEPMGVALRRMAGRDVGRLPVVSRSDPRRVLGVVRRSDIVRAYNLAIIRKTAVAHRAAALRLGTLTGAEVLEIRLTDGSPAVGKRLADVSLPGECLIASVRRGRQVLVPSGRTELQAGDVLVAVCNREMSGALRDRLTGGSAASGSSSL